MKSEGWAILQKKYQEENHGHRNYSGKYQGNKGSDSPQEPRTTEPKIPGRDPKGLSEASPFAQAAATQRHRPGGSNNRTRWCLCPGGRKAELQGRAGLAGPRHPSFLCQRASSSSRGVLRARPAVSERPLVVGMPVVLGWSPPDGLISF